MTQARPEPSPPRKFTFDTVFDGDRVRFDDVGRLPEDIVGAEAMTYAPPRGGR